MKKVFISQPMKGMTREEIKLKHESIIKHVSDILEDEQFEVIDTVFDHFEGATPLKYIAKSIMALAEADYVYFADGWQKARGCRIERECAWEYDLNIIYD